jgi:hypothetical protein
MSNPRSGDQLRAGMTEDQKVAAVSSGHATRQQLNAGVLEDPEELRNAGRPSLAETEPSFEKLPPVAGSSDHPIEIVLPPKKTASRRRLTRKSRRKPGAATKQRFGLPTGFVLRLQRYGRSVLLAQNIYRLPNGQELIPCHPHGTLGKKHHLYALITAEQYRQHKRGSVYMRHDGRIFDYSVDSANDSGDLFDTGYTIYDLERTGQYAPELRERQKKRAKTGSRSRAAIA